MKVHNSSIKIAGDWLEASILFDEDCDLVTRSDGIDFLVDMGFYNDQSFADEFLGRVWVELGRRARRLGDSSPYEITGKALKRVHPWVDIPAHAFCMVLSMVNYYDDLIGPIGVSHPEQGELFERIAECSLTELGWRVMRTGWAGGQKNVKLPEVVNQVANHLNEGRINHGVVEEYKTMNEHGLDLVISRPFFQDERGGKPTFLVQCASGSNEAEKRHTPDIVTWSKLISFSSNPVRGFVVPFSYEDSDFFQLCSAVDGMVVERYRLLSAGKDGPNWMPEGLKDRLRDTIGAKLHDIEQLRVN